MPAPILDTTDIEHLRRQFAAWMDGVEARLLDVRLHKNPHPARSAAGDAWENGWERVNRGLRMNRPTSDPAGQIVSKLRLWAAGHTSDLPTNLSRMAFSDMGALADWIETRNK